MGASPLKWAINSAGVLDSSGLKFTYASTPPRQRASVLSVGFSSNSFLIIPPNRDKFDINAVCADTCTKKVYRYMMYTKPLSYIKHLVHSSFRLMESLFLETCSIHIWQVYQMLQHGIIVLIIIIPITIKINTSGHGLVVRHFRESECGLLEELEPIDENRRYDFNYQQVTLLPKPVKVLPVNKLFWLFKLWLISVYTQA